MVKVITLSQLQNDESRSDSTKEPVESLLGKLVVVRINIQSETKKTFWIILSRKVI